MSDEDEFYRRSKSELFPKIRDSAMSVTIAPGDDPDPKICMEMGAAIFFDKPIIAVVPTNRRVSANLRRVASVILQMNDDDPNFSQKLSAAIDSVMKNDARAKG